MLSARNFWRYAQHFSRPRSLTSPKIFPRLSTISINHLLLKDSSLNKRLFHSSTPLKDQKDYYQILGISRNATDAEIKAQYKKLAKQYHPDVNPGGVEKFKEISAAYEVLSKPEKRRMYDMHGAEGVDGFNAGAPGFDPFEIFQSAFGGDMFGGFGGRSSRPTQAPPISVSITTSLEDLFKGKPQEISFKKNVSCRTCDGTGSKSKRVNQCNTCSGSGFVFTTRKLGPGMIQQFQQPCSNCGGTGETTPPSDRCGTCHGQKVVSEKAHVRIPIDPTIESGQQILVPGEGNQLPGGTRGDLVVTVNIPPHPVFKRVGDNLYIEEKISIAQALCGSPVVISHLDGKKIHFDLKPGEIQPGFIKEIKNEGMTIPESSQKGNLFVKLNIDFSKSKSLSQEELANLSTIFGYDKPKSPSSSTKVEVRDVPESILNQGQQRKDRRQKRGGGKGEKVECAQM